MMKTIKAGDSEFSVSVDNTSDCDGGITLWQDDCGRKDYNMVILTSEEITKQTIAAIKEAAKDLGWEV